MIAVGVGDENVRHRLAADSIEHRAHMRRIIGAWIDDRDVPAAEDIAHGSLEGEWTRVGGHHAPHARHPLPPHIPGASEIFVERNIVAHVPSNALAGTGLPLFRPYLHPSERQMIDVLRALIPAMWLLWLAYWVLAGRKHKATLRRENSLSRLSHYGPLILGGALIGIPNSAGPAMAQPFHAVTLPWLLAATALVAAGLGFSALARLWLGRN